MADDPEPARRRHPGLMALVFVWPLAAVSWAVLSLMGVPVFYENGFIAGLLMVGWAVALVLTRHRLRASGILGWRAPQ